MSKEFPERRSKELKHDTLSDETTAGVQRGMGDKKRELSAAEQERLHSAKSWEETALDILNKIKSVTRVDSNVDERALRAAFEDYLEALRKGKKDFEELIDTNKRRQELTDSDGQ